MILNELVFIVNNNVEFVPGSQPVGKLTANSLNRDFIYFISPFRLGTSVVATFKNELQGKRGETAYLVASNKKVSELVSENKSYYELIKDWNVWQTHIPSKALGLVSHSRANQVSISFNVKEKIVPTIPYGYEYVRDITDIGEVNIDGAYVVKTTQLEVNDIVYNFNDLLLFKYNQYKKRSAVVFGGGTPTLKYSVDPNVYDSEYDLEVDEYSLVDELLGLVGETKDNVDFTYDLLLDHKTDRNNPHEVTADEVGAYDKEESDNRFAPIAHISDKNNPHEVKGTQITVGGNEQLKDLSVENAIDYLNTQRLALENNKENKSNKANDFTVLNNTKYPSVLATYNEILARILEHNNDPVAHTILKTAIDVLEQKIDRLEARGIPYGHIDKTNTELENMTLSDRNNYINNYINNLFDGYTPSVNDFIDTKDSKTENEHRWYYNGTNWVDMGANTIIKATDLSYGIVKGDGVNVSIVDGILNVIKSAYANAVGDSNGSLNYTQINNALNNIFNALGDIYLKSETYNRDEIDLKIATLKAIYGWSESDLASLSENEIYTIDTNYSFLILEELLSGKKISYIVVINNLSNSDYGANINIDNGVIEYTGNESVKITGYKVKDYEIQRLEKRVMDLETELRDKPDEREIITDEGYGLVVKNNGVGNVKTELSVSGKNLAKPDLSGKEYLGGGVYKLHQQNGGTLTYNVYSGEYRLFGNMTGELTYNFGYNRSYADDCYIQIWKTKQVVWDASSNSSIVGFSGGSAYQVLINKTRNYDGKTPLLTTLNEIYTYNILGNIDVYFRLQLEQGTTATDYEIPYIETHKPMATKRISINDSHLYLKSNLYITPETPLTYENGNYKIGDTIINSSGILQATPNEPIIITNHTNQVGIYQDNLMLDFNIKDIEKIIKLNIDGSQTILDNDNIITITDNYFTHQDINNGDLIYVIYERDTIEMMPKLDTSYYNSDKIIIDSETDTAYKWKVKIANGIATIETEEV